MTVQLVFNNGFAKMPVVGDRVFVMSTPYRVFAVHRCSVYVTYDGKGH